MAHIFKLVFQADHKGFAANEGAAFDLQTAAKLVATGVCAIDDSEPEKTALEEAVRAYKQPKPSGRRWEMMLVQPRYFVGREPID